MFARSTVSVDRPFAGRSTAAVFGLMVALIASLVISVATARASDDSQVAEQSSETVQSATATASPATTEASVAPVEPVAPVAQESEPVAEESAEPAPAPTETEIPETDDSPEAPATEAPAEQPPVTTGEPSDPEPTQTEQTETEPTAPAPVEPPSASATAQNQSQTWQAVFQVQQGCQSYCQGTSQSQVADQSAETIQSATAIGGGTGSPSNATALNQSITGQFIWQVQLGCVAFCYGTSQSQTANQWAETTQNATALADGNAQAHNVGSVMQEVWQLQFGCETECYGNSQTQSSTQGQSTNQSATATSETWAPSYPSDVQSLLPAWLVALAENLGITIQTSWQYQEAGCLQHCVGDSQAQEASQSALTTQEARAVAGIPPEEPDPPVVDTPPVAQTPPAGAPAATVATAASADSNSGKTFVERASATWSRVSGDGKTGSRIRQRSSVKTSSGIGTETRVESSTRVETGSSSSKTTTSTNTSSSSTTSSSSNSADLESVKMQPLEGLGKSDYGFGAVGWLLIGLLMAFGLVTLRRTSLRSPAT